MRAWFFSALFSAAMLLLSACSNGPQVSDWPANDGPPIKPPATHELADAQVRAVHRGSAANPASYTVLGETYHVMDTPAGYVETGIASWYGRKFHGKPTSNGETFDMYEATAAHKTLPIPCYVQVTHIENGESIVVRVNDRGPFHPDRIIDLSWAAAEKLGITASGTGRVEVRALETPASSDVWLQVGAYRSRQNAEIQLAQLIRSGFERAQLQRAKDLYRLRLGPYADADSAEAELRRLRDAGYSQARRASIQ